MLLLWLQLMMTGTVVLETGLSCNSVGPDRGEWAAVPGKGSVNAWKGRRVGLEIVFTCHLRLGGMTPAKNE